MHGTHIGWQSWHIGWQSAQNVMMHGWHMLTTHGPWHGPHEHSLHCGRPIFSSLSLIAEIADCSSVMAMFRSLGCCSSATEHSPLQTRMAGRVAMLKLNCQGCAA